MHLDRKPGLRGCGAGRSSPDSESLEFFGWRAATCSSNRRVNEINPDPAAVVLRQIEGLMARTAQFSDRVQGR